MISVLLPSRSSSTVADAKQALAEATRRVLSRRFRIFLLVRDAYERMIAHGNVLSAVSRDLRTMMRLLLQWATRSYQRVSWAPLAIITAALLYFVAPVDLIPDALGAVGLVDDATVISTAVNSIRSELQRFRAWEQARTLTD